MATILNYSPTSGLIVKVLQAAASRIGVEIEVLYASTGPEIDTAFAGLVQARIDALVVSAGPPFNDHTAQIVAMAARHALPAIYPNRTAAEAGGLMSYSPSADRLSQVGVYVGRILKGEKPGDLPVMLPTKFELVINLKVAKTLGIEVPPSLLSIADEVIE
jgi:putative tryptophan/tyrosine transport system substrate-binding protein